MLYFCGLKYHTFSKCCLSWATLCKDVSRVDGVGVWTNSKGSKPPSMLLLLNVLTEINTRPRPHFIAWFTKRNQSTTLAK